MIKRFSVLSPKPLTLAGKQLQNRDLALITKHLNIFLFFLSHSATWESSKQETFRRVNELSSTSCSFWPWSLAFLHRSFILSITKAFLDQRGAVGQQIALWCWREERSLNQQCHRAVRADMFSLLYLYVSRTVIPVRSPIVSSCSFVIKTNEL